MITHETDQRLQRLCCERGLSDDLIRQIVDSGFYLRTLVNPISSETWETVSDMMYGNKQFSSSFAIDEFLAHVTATRKLDSLPSFVEETVRTWTDVQEVLSTPRRQRYMSDGTFSFRGQTSSFTIHRSIPNPRRSDSAGRELSVMPGLYRQSESRYSFSKAVTEVRSWEYFLRDLEPHDQDLDSHADVAYDIMRTEQHYAAATRGLDLSFAPEPALFFATHRFTLQPTGRVTYEPVKRGEHTGVIYCFRFRDPPVKRSEYFIRDFELFRTYRPERLLRQQCGLPLIGGHERNIAITDIDCIIHLDSDFRCQSDLSSQQLFPGVGDDPFYAKLLELKDRYPTELRNVVEYEWARHRTNSCL